MDRIRTSANAMTCNDYIWSPWTDSRIFQPGLDARPRAWPPGGMTKDRQGNFCLFRSFGRGFETGSRGCLCWETEDGVFIKTYRPRIFPLAG